MATIDEIVFELEGDTRGLDAALKRSGVKLDRSTKKMVNDLNRVDKGVSSLGSTFRTLGGILATIGIARLGREMVTAASDMQQLNTRLITTTGSIEGAAEAMGFLRETASRQSIDLLTLATGFNKLLPSVKAGSISMDDLKTIITLTNDNIKALGISTGDTERIFFGLSQVFGSGIVTMENLKQVTEVLPGSLIKIAESMGKLGKTTNGTLGELVKLVSTGTLASKDLKEALISSFRANEGAAEKMANTFESAMVRLRNATREAFSEAAQESGFLETITASINSLSDSLNKPEFKAGLELLATTFSILIKAAELGIIAIGNINEGAQVIGESLTTAGVQILNFLGIVDDDFKNAVTAEFRERMFGVAESAEKVTEKLKKATPELDKLGKKANEVKDKIKQQSTSLAALVRNLELEIKVSKLGDRERVIEIAKRKAINLIMKDTKLKQADVIREYKKEIQAITKLTGTLFDLERAEKDVKEETKELTKATEELSRESIRAAENIQDSLADAIGDVITNLDDLEGVGKRVFNNLLKFAIDAFSQIAAQQILGSIFAGGGGGGGGLASAIGGGGGSGGGVGGIGQIFSLGKSLFGGGGGGIGSIFGPATGAINQVGASLGFGGVTPGFIGPSLPGTGVASAAGSLTVASLSSVFSGAGIGAGIGSANFFGGNQTGSTVGGTVGGIAGSFFGPIGSVIGSTIGSAIGGLFGGKEGVKASEFASEFGGATTFGAKGQSTEFAENLFAQLSAFTERIQQAGGAQFQGNIRGGFNSRGGGGFLTIGETRLNFDPENIEQTQQAFNDLTEILLDTAIIADEEVGDALRNLQLDGLSAAEAIRAVSIASGLLSEQFNQQLEQEILRLTDARAFEIKQIEGQTAALKEEALAIGANVELVEKLGQLRLDQLSELQGGTLDVDDAVAQQALALREQESIQNDVTKALEASRKEAQKLSDQFAKIAADLKQVALDLQLGDLSALSPEEQLDISRQAFTDLSRRAALGDVAAAQALPSAATAFLEESRNFNASNAAFKSDFASVQTGLLGAGDVFTRQSANQASVVDAINNSINASNGGLNAIVAQLITLTQQGSTQTQTLRDLIIKLSA